MRTLLFALAVLGATACSRRDPPLGPAPSAVGSTSVVRPSAADAARARNRALRTAPKDYQLTAEPCPVTAPRSPRDPDVAIFPVAELDQAPATAGDPGRGHDFLVVAESRSPTLLYGRLYVWDRARQTFVCAGEVNARGSELEAQALRSKLLALQPAAKVPHPDAAAPPPARQGKRVLQAAVGDNHFCALTEDGVVSCFGQNDEAQTGQVGGAPLQPKPVPVPRIQDAVELAAGGRHNCVRTRAGAVWCWGANFFGQLGAGPEGEHGPVRVPGLGSIVQLGLGADQSCALRKEGQVLCWGNTASAHGVDKDPIEQQRSVRPEPIVGLPPAVEVCGGAAFSCARLGAGGIRCWGSWYGAAPVAIEGAETATTLSCHSASAHVCYVTDGHEARCVTRARSTRDMPAVPGAAAIADGFDHACVLLLDGTVQCWGSGEFGQLGDGLTVARTSPLPVPALRAVKALGVGHQRSAAILADDGLVTWGYGPIGDGRACDGPPCDGLVPTAISF